MSTEQKAAERQILVNIGLPPLILDKVDQMRGDIPRSAFLRKRIIQIIEKEVEIGGQPA